MDETITAEPLIDTSVFGGTFGVGGGKPITKEDVYKAKTLYESTKAGRKHGHNGEAARSLLTPEQEKTNRQLQQAAQQGSFAPAAEYYQNLLSNNPEDLQAFQAPEMRRFNEQTIPGLSEQFAGMGAGGLSSSGFRNAAVSASTDLGERLAAIRANLRQGAAQGLMNIGQTALNPQKENTFQQAAPSMWGPIAGAAGTAVGAYFGGVPGAAAGNAAGNAAGSAVGDYLSKSRDIYGSSTSLTGGDRG